MLLNTNHVRVFFLQSPSLVILSEAKNLRSCFWFKYFRRTAEMLRGVYPERTAGILRFAQNDKRRAQHDRFPIFSHFHSTIHDFLP
jgi:hypothetical protein